MKTREMENFSYSDSTVEGSYTRLFPVSISGVRVFILSLLVLPFLFTGCKQKELVVEKKIRNMSVRKIVRVVDENELKFNTLSVKKFSLTVDNNGVVNSIRGSYKIANDSVIQLVAQKLNIQIGKIEIAKDSLKAVNYLGKSYYTTGYKYVSQLLGGDIDFKVIQAILSNQLQPIKEDPEDKEFSNYDCVIENNMYKISSIKERKFKRVNKKEDRLERFKQKMEENHHIRQDIYVDPEKFVVNRMMFHDFDSDRSVTIEFSNFVQLNQNWFPEKIHCKISGSKPIDIQIELSKVSVDDESSFGFSIPSNYKRKALPDL